MDTEICSFAIFKGLFEEFNAQTYKVIHFDLIWLWFTVWIEYDSLYEDVGI